MTPTPAEPRPAPSTAHHDVPGGRLASPVARLLVFCAGTALAAVGGVLLGDSMARAFWSLAAVVLLLVLAWEDRPPCRVDWRSYGLACAPVLAMTLITVGLPATVVVGSVSLSLVGMLMLLVRFGLSCPLAIGLLLVQSALFLTWPVWAANLLLEFDVQATVDVLVSIGPLFAINGVLDPSDAFTHRPLAYRLMNLGQDIPYEMPRSIWPCVMVHLATGMPGILWYAGRGWRRAAGEKRAKG